MVAAGMHPLPLGSLVRFDGFCWAIEARSYGNRGACPVRYDLKLPGDRNRRRVIGVPGERVEPLVVEPAPRPAPRDWVADRFLLNFRGWADVQPEDGDILPAPVRA